MRYKGYEGPGGRGRRRADRAAGGRVVDGNLITSRHPGDLTAFCREMMRAIEG